MKKNKSICFVVYSLRGGGSERIIALLSSYIVENFLVDIYIVMLSNEYPFYTLSPKVKVITPPFLKKNFSYIKYYLKIFFFLRKTYKKLKPDRIVSFGETINAFVIISTFLKNIQIYVSNRASPLSNLRGYRGFINPLFYPFAKGVFIQTDEGINLLKKKYKLTNFIKLSNPVINNINCIPIQRRDKIIINVGYLGGNKNQAALIRYFSEIENYDWKLYLIGDGPDREKLKSLIDTLQLNERVFLLGARTDVNKLLNNAQIFAFTSLTEGFPNALAEALAAGCACISFDCITGPRELIKNNYNGYLVDINDNEGYKTKLAELMNSFELREKFSKSSLEKIKQFNIDTITKQFINILFPQND